MTLSLTGLDNNLIHIYLDLFVYYVMQKNSGCPLVSSTSLLQAEGHDSVTKSPPGSGKSSLSHVLRIHLDLVVPVNERQHCMIDSVINQYINDGKRVIILGTSLVQIYVVYTHPYLPICLRPWPCVFRHHSEGISPFLS